MKICRQRWVIIRNEDEIFCGLTKDFKFKKIDDIGDTPLKTYLSKAKAESGFRRSWYLPERENWKVVPVIETIESKYEIKLEAEDDIIK